MCKKRNSVKVLLRNGFVKVDSCLPNLLQTIEAMDKGNHNKLTTYGSCCGHGKYNMTIIVKDQYSPYPFELLSGITIKRKRNFYRKDKQGYYYIPEVNQSKEQICECKHKQWAEHKSSFYQKNKDLKMVAQECNVKGCKCKKFKKQKEVIIPKSPKVTKKI